MEDGELSSAVETAAEEKRRPGSDDHCCKDRTGRQADRRSHSDYKRSLEYT